MTDQEHELRQEAAAAQLAETAGSPLQSTGVSGVMNRRDLGGLDGAGSMSPAEISALIDDALDETADEGPPSNLEAACAAELKQVFGAFAAWGRKGSSPAASPRNAKMSLSATQFAKLCRDSGIVEVRF